MFVYDGDLVEDALLRWALEDYGAHAGYPVPPLPNILGAIEKWFLKSTKVVEKWLKWVMCDGQGKLCQHITN